MIGDRGRGPGIRGICGPASAAARPVLGIALAMVLGGVAIRIMGVDPMSAYGNMLMGAFGSRNAIGETLIKASPLAFTGLAFAFAMRCGLINMGGEGQLYMGALGSALVGVYLSGLPAAIHIPLALVAGFSAGGLWGLVAGWLKVKFGASEIITTVMLNYIATILVGFLVTGPLMEPPGLYPQTAMVLASARLPRLLAGTRLHLGVPLALLALGFYYVFLWHMPRGFELRVVGQNPRAARYAGMDASRSALAAMFLAGGMAGLAGGAEILGVQMRLRPGLSPGFGFDGLAVALLGANHPVGILLSSLLFGALRSGGNMMRLISRVPAAITFVIQGLVILFVVAEPGFRDMINKRRLARAARRAEA